MKIVFNMHLPIYENMLPNTKLNKILYFVNNMIQGLK